MATPIFNAKINITSSNETSPGVFDIDINISSRGRRSVQDNEIGDFSITECEFGNAILRDLIQDRSTFDCILQPECVSAVICGESSVYSK